MRASLTRNFLLAGMAIAAVVVIVIFAMTLFRPLGANVLPVNHHLQGSEEFTCGPAAAAEALSWYSVMLTERQAVLDCGTNRYGTSVQEEVSGLQKHAHVTVVSGTPRWALDEVFVLGFTEADQTAHMVCVHSRRDGRWDVDDPAIPAGSVEDSSYFSKPHLVAIEIKEPQ